MAPVFGRKRQVNDSIDWNWPPLILLFFIRLPDFAICLQITKRINSSPYQGAVFCKRILKMTLVPRSEIEYDIPVDSDYALDWK